jgi:hypothetical protein
VDNKPNNSMISPKSWAAALWFSRFLCQADREAVLGDLTESGESGGRAIVNILGLVVRRWTTDLFDMQVWFAVGFCILPISYLLSAIAQNTAGIGAVYSWMYLNNWDWALTRNPGFWHLLRETAIYYGISCLVLACWSWSGGFLIDRLPNGNLRANRIAFSVLLAALFLVDVPARLIQFWMSSHGVPALPDVNAPITANLFYLLFFPWVVLAMLVILPGLSGIRHGNRSLVLERKIRVVLVTAATISVLILLIHVPGVNLLFGAGVRDWLWRNRSAMQVLPLLSCWPLFYVVANGFGRYRGRNATVAE